MIDLNDAFGKFNAGGRWNVLSVGAGVWVVAVIPRQTERGWAMDGTGRGRSVVRRVRGVLAVAYAHFPHLAAQVFTFGPLDTKRHHVVRIVVCVGVDRVLLV